MRGLAQIVACDSHPLVVPRVRDYLEHQFNLGESARMDWCRHWIAAALGGIEEHLKDPQTGTFCHGDEITIADICLASQGAGARFYGVDIGAVSERRPHHRHLPGDRRVCPRPPAAPAGRAGGVGQNEPEVFLENETHNYRICYERHNTWQPANH